MNNKLWLLVTLLIATGSFHGMDSTSLCELRRTGSEQLFLVGQSDYMIMSPITLRQTYQHFSECTLPEIAQYILSLQLEVSGIDMIKLPTLIEQSCDNPRDFVSYIWKLFISGGYVLTIELLERYFFSRGKSICEIRGFSELTPLHIATCWNYLSVIEILIKIADKGKETLLTEQDVLGDTALHNAVNNNNVKIIELLLDAAGNKAPDLIAIKNNRGNAAFDVCTLNLKEIMRKHLQKHGKIDQEYKISL